MRAIIISAVVLALSLTAYLLFSGASKNEKRGSEVLAVAKKGDFSLTVTATGELQAKRSEKIMGPQSMRSVGIFQTNISDMVIEGTVLKAGDYVATLDRTELATKMQETQTELEKTLTQLEQAKLDTAIQLRDMRNQLVNLQFSVKEKKLQVEQSRFEPQSVIRQAELENEKTEREFTQLTANYKLKQQQSIAKIQEINATLRQQQNRMDLQNQLAQQFTVMAPKDGMVIYHRRWGDTKKVGSQVSSWDPIVAELPDLTDMVSKVFVNEVDISRVQKGQPVTIRVDAFPEKKYTGTVITVANVGEELRNYDSKVFEVIVQVHETDSILRPAMTTSIEIETDKYPSKLYIPLEALYKDSLDYVFKWDNGKIVKQEVVKGQANSNEVIVDLGLNENEQVYLSAPANAGKLSWVYLDEKNKAEVIRKQIEENKAHQAAAMEKMKQVKENVPTGDGGGGGGMIIIE